MLELSVVVPAYNEAPAIKSGKLKRIAQWLAVQPFAGELILVDDGSQDQTAALAQGTATQVIRIPHSGKASAIVAGIQSARGELVLFSDMDQATPIEEATRLIQAIQGGSQVAIGSRGLARSGAPVGRYVLSWGQVLVRRLFLGLQVTDTQCGFKAMTRPAALDILDCLRLYHPSRAREILGPSVTSGFDVEFLFVARRLGYRIAEVPVAWNYQETRRVNLLRDAGRGMQDILQIYLAGLAGKYPHSSPGAAGVIERTQAGHKVQIKR